MLPIKREIDFPVTDVACAPLHSLHDQQRGIYHCSIYEGLRIIDESFGPRWLLSETDSVMLPVNKFNGIDLSLTDGRTQVEVLGRLAEDEYGLDMYLRSWTSQPFTQNGLVSRVQAYWEKDCHGCSRKVMTSTELHQIVDSYQTASKRNAKCGLKIHPWVSQWFEGGKASVGSNGPDDLNTSIEAYSLHGMPSGNSRQVTA